MRCNFTSKMKDRMRLCSDHHPPIPGFITEPRTLDNTLGALFLGVVVSCILFGVSSLQVVHYYHSYANDSLLHKVAVGSLWVLDSTHLCLSIASSYHYGISNFGRADAMDVIIWSVLIAVNVMIVVLVHSLYAYRVWLLSGYHHGFLGYVVAAIVLGGFVLAYETCTLQTFSETPQIAWAVEASYATSTIIDVIISVAMCWYLAKSKRCVRRSGISHIGCGNFNAAGGSFRADHEEEGKQSLLLNSRISALMGYTLSCGIFTSAISVSCLFTFLLMPNNLVFLALSYLVTRLYVTSFMSMMNARTRRTRYRRSSSSSSNKLNSNSNSNLTHTFTRTSRRSRYISSVAFNSSPSALRDGESGSMVGFSPDSTSPSTPTTDKYDPSWADLPSPVNVPAAAVHPHSVHSQSLTVSTSGGYYTPAETQLGSAPSPTKYSYRYAI
ncbi:hypothetical protein R3P38DRAFT_3112886 [Favolaschia claudopus]|uniref:DUF6534 domain-containing protein n=1 Tax=Favolaschia claudopus TaxID=2862362 RepID=A0AAV9ZI41_9AGAR